MAQPCVTALADDPVRQRADCVARSRLFRFQGIVSVQALPVGSSQSDIVLYSCSLKGHDDFGVNRGWVEAPLAALDKALDWAKQL